MTRKVISMAIKNTVLVYNKLGSRLARLGVVSTIGISAVFAGFISLQYLYQQKVEQFFVNQIPIDPQALIIRSHNHWITTGKNHFKTYQPLLAKTLGDYKSHRFLGWHASYEDWRTSQDGLPITLLYEVQYELGVSQETFLFKGVMPARLMAREVRIH